MGICLQETQFLDKPLKFNKYYGYRNINLCGFEVRLQVFMYSIRL